MKIQTNSGCLTVFVLLLYLLLTAWLVCCFCEWSIQQGTADIVKFLKGIVEFVAWAIGLLVHTIAHAIKTA